jgi:hypothetical protein
MSPDQTVAEIAGLLRAYDLDEVQGDRYAAGWTEESFRRHGIRYSPAPKPTSDLHLSLAAALNSKRVVLLDHPVLVRELKGLNRRMTRSGREHVDHRSGRHDDAAVACAGAVAQVLDRRKGFIETGPFDGPWWRSDGTIVDSTGRVICRWNENNVEQVRALLRS